MGHSRAFLESDRREVQASLWGRLREVPERRTAWRSRVVLNVLITVDTEVWPYTPYWRETQLGEEMDCYIWGSTSKGSFGLPYQTALLREHGLRAVFFVESLFACVVGMERLQQIVEILRGSGQEVQLHIHTEWLERMEASPLGTHFGPNMKDFSAAEQQVLIALGRENLARCGV